MLATEKGQANTIDALLTAGANINFSNDLGETALMRAAQWGETSIVQKLLAAGADPYVQNNMGETALDIANNRGQTQVTRILRPYFEKTKME